MSVHRAASNSPTQLSKSKDDAMKSDAKIELKAQPLWPPKLLHFHEIPPWQQDNEFILSGYRATSGSYRVSAESLSYLHNQTINIYSHLIGCFVFLSLPVYFYTQYYRHQAGAKLDDLIIFSVYALGVAVCFAFSATFHTMWNHSHAVTAFCNRLDYLGILVLMWGAGIPTIYYGFFCNPNLRLLYWTMTSSTALGCGYATLHPTFILPKFRHYRAIFYAGFGLSSIIFVVHGLMLHGWEVQRIRMSLVWMGWMGTANLTGALIYAARIPERWVPYQFDIFGASHQVFHVAVIIAAFIHFGGLLEAFAFIRSNDDICA